MLPRAPRAVVFDMDGLLVDTEVLVREAMMDQALEMGRELPLPVFLSMVGTNHATSEQVLVDHFGPGFPLGEFKTSWVKRYRVLSEAGVSLKTGVVELLDQLDALKIPRAVCTSSHHREVNLNLTPHGLIDRFQQFVAHGDYARGKPAPDPFLKAAEVLGVAPDFCLALEDSHNGVRAAHAAGMMTIMVPDLLEPTAEIEGLCVRIVESLHEVCDLISAAARLEDMT